MGFIVLYKSIIPETFMICYLYCQVSPGIRSFYLCTSFCSPLQILQFQTQPFISEQLQRLALTLSLHSLVIPPKLIPAPPSMYPLNTNFKSNTIFTSQSLVTGNVLYQGSPVAVTGKDSEELPIFKPKQLHCHKVQKGKRNQGKRHSSNKDRSKYQHLEAESPQTQKTVEKHNH